MASHPDANPDSSPPSLPDDIERVSDTPLPARENIEAPPHAPADPEADETKHVALAGTRHCGSGGGVFPGRVPCDDRAIDRQPALHGDGRG